VRPLIHLALRRPIVLSIDSLVQKALSRRSFLAGAGAATAATVVGCSNGNTGITTTSSTTYTDADVLNFALNLEYLEAQFYLYAATGSGLAAADTAAPSGYTGSFTQGTVTTSGNITVGKVGTGTQGSPLALTTAQQDILNEIAFEEQQHVRFLRAALGSAAVPMPSIDLTFFSTLAMVAGITSSASGSGAFTPYDNFNDFLIGSFIFEDVGVTAYAGAAPLISAAGVAAGYLTAAAGILAVEAYHAAYVRTAITAAALANSSSTYIGIANKVEALRATLTVGASGAPSTGTGNSGATDSSTAVETSLVLPTYTASTTSATPSGIVQCDATNAIGFARTVNQVHHIVYGNATVGAKNGGFFPNGTNSIFAVTTA